MESRDIARAWPAVVQLLSKMIPLQVRSDEHCLVPEGAAANEIDFPPPPPPPPRARARTLQGKTIADIGAGTGLFMKPFVETVGERSQKSLRVLANLATPSIYRDFAVSRCD